MLWTIVIPCLATVAFTLVAAPALGWLALAVDWGGGGEEEGDG